LCWYREVLLLIPAEGKPAIDFNTPDLHGNVIKLFDFKGKYLLLDFWASCCVPCRATMPKLKEVYRQYHEQGLEIVAVSVDVNQELWEKAIEHDGTGIWHQVLSNGGKDNQPQIHQQYAVTVYPTKILINPEGIIVGRFYDTHSDAKLLSGTTDLSKEQ
jgi:thiol-disulfide isomerase/thioredoxin